MTIDEQIKILEAARDGKKIEVRGKYFTELQSWMPMLDLGDFNFSVAEYRIAEPKKKRLMRPSELAGKWIRRSGDSGCGSLCWAFTESRFSAGKKFILANCYHEWTDTPNDPNSWKSVVVE